MKTDKKQGLYDDLPIPKVAAVVGWLTCCFICFGALLAGKALFEVFYDWTVKIKVSDIVIALVVGKVFHLKNIKSHQKKGEP